MVAIARAGFSPPPMPRRIAHADIVLFQCKAHATRAAAEAAKHLIDGGGVAISFQNGLGNEEALAELLGKEHVLGGVTPMAGCKLGPGVIRDFSRAPSRIGEMMGGVSDRARKTATILTDAGLETRASGNIIDDIWKKLLGNVAMSAISGITDLTSAEVLAVPALERTCFAALNEAWTLQPLLASSSIGQQPFGIGSDFRAGRCRRQQVVPLRRSLEPATDRGRRHLRFGHRSGPKARHADPDFGRPLSDRERVGEPLPSGSIELTIGEAAIQEFSKRAGRDHRRCDRRKRGCHLILPRYFSVSSAGTSLPS